MLNLKTLNAMKKTLSLVVLAVAAVVMVGCGDLMNKVSEICASCPGCEELAPAIEAAAEELAPAVEAATAEIAPAVEAAAAELAPAVEAAAAELDPSVEDAVVKAVEAVEAIEAAVEAAK